MKEIDFNLNNNPFINFQSSRYSISSRINAEPLWKYCQSEKYSFFILSLACLMNAVNSVPQLKRRIMNDKVIEYDYLDGVCPIMDEENEIYKEMRVDVPYDDIFKWHDYVKKHQKDILKGKKESFTLAMEKRDMTNIANFSCIPWIDFDCLTTAIANGRQIQPLITWGKVNRNYEMSVAITVNHIFVNGRELGYFYENAQKNFNKF